MYPSSVGHVFDLRSKQEVEKGWKGITTEGDGIKDVKAGWEEDMKSVGVERHWVPVFEEKDYSPEKLAVRYMVSFFFPFFNFSALFFLSFFVFSFLSNIPWEEKKAKKNH